MVPNSGRCGSRAEMTMLEASSRTTRAMRVRSGRAFRSTDNGELTIGTRWTRFTCESMTWIALLSPTTSSGTPF